MGHNDDYKVIPRTAMLRMLAVKNQQNFDLLQCLCSSSCKYQGMTYEAFQSGLILLVDLNISTVAHFTD